MSTIIKTWSALKRWCRSADGLGGLLGFLIAIGVAYGWILFARWLMGGMALGLALGLAVNGLVIVAGYRWL